MYMEGVITKNCYIRNKPDLTSDPIFKALKGESIKITDIENTPIGYFYYIESSGYVYIKNVRITKDIEFYLKNNKLLLGDILGSIFDNSISSISKNPIKLTTGGGCFGTSGSIGGLESLSDIKLSSLGSVFGVNIGKTAEKILSGTTVSSLFDGTFLSTIADNALDTLLGYAFERLSYVVGFDVESILSQFFVNDGSVNISALDNNLFSEYAKYDSVEESAVLGTSQTIGFDESFNKASHYFDYLGLGGNPGEVIAEINDLGQTYFVDDLVLDGPSGQRFTTPLLNGDNKNQDEVKFNTALYENKYEEFEESIKEVKKNIDYGIERMDWFTKFNRYKKTDPNYHLTGSSGHIFMTRPDLNIFNNGGDTINPDLAKSPDGTFFTGAINRHGTCAKSLTSYLDDNHDFIPIIHNTARSIDIQDLSIETAEYGEALTHWKIMYAQDMTKSLTSGTFSIDYIDDYQLSISFLHLIWLNYIHAVSRGQIHPRPEHVKRYILDYAASCYYILTDATGANIIFWSKFWGVFPTNYPSSTFSMREGDMVKLPQFTINYTYSFKRDMDPLILAEFNRNSKSSGNFDWIPIHKSGEIIPYQSMVGAPFIDTPDGGTTFKLRFRPPSDNNSGGGGNSFNPSINTLLNYV